jgi:hypothetical protein
VGVAVARGVAVGLLRTAEVAVATAVPAAAAAAPEVGAVAAVPVAAAVGTAVGVVAATPVRAAAAVPVTRRAAVASAVDVAGGVMVMPLRLVAVTAGVLLAVAGRGVAVATTGDDRATVDTVMGMPADRVAVGAGVAVLTAMVGMAVAPLAARDETVVLTGRVTAKPIRFGEPLAGDTIGWSGTSVAVGGRGVGESATVSGDGVGVGATGPGRQATVTPSRSSTARAVSDRRRVTPGRGRHRTARAQGAPRSRGRRDRAVRVSYLFASIASWRFIRTPDG